MIMQKDSQVLLAHGRESMIEDPRMTALAAAIPQFSLIVISKGHLIFGYI
jgi:hypothetical protein